MDKEDEKATGLIILFRRGTFSGGTKAFFAYGFAKSQRANTDKEEEGQFKEAAKHVLALTEKQPGELLKRGDFVEVKNDEQKVSKRSDGSDP